MGCHEELQSHYHDCHGNESSQLQNIIDQCRIYRLFHLDRRLLVCFLVFAARLPVLLRRQRVRLLLRRWSTLLGQAEREKSYTAQR